MSRAKNSVHLGLAADSVSQADYDMAAAMDAVTGRGRRTFFTSVRLRVRGVPMDAYVPTQEEEARRLEVARGLNASPGELWFNDDGRLMLRTSDGDDIWQYDEYDLQQILEHRDPTPPRRRGWMPSAAYAFDASHVQHSGATDSLGHIVFEGVAHVSFHHDTQRAPWADLIAETWAAAVNHSSTDDSHGGPSTQPSVEFDDPMAVDTRSPEQTWQQAEEAVEAWRRALREAQHHVHALRMANQALEMNLPRNMAQARAYGNSIRPLILAVADARVPAQDAITKARDRFTQAKRAIADKAHQMARARRERILGAHNGDDRREFHAQEDERWLELYGDVPDGDCECEGVSMNYFDVLV